MKKTFFSLLLGLAVSTMFAQGTGKQTFTRMLLLEQFTTVNCGYCPAGADRIASAIGTSTNVIWVKHHAGFGEDFLTNDIHRAFLAFYNGNTFAPAMMVDRTLFDASNPGPVFGVGNVADVRGVFNEAKQVPTTCKVLPIELGYDNASRMLSITVKGRFGEDNAWDANTRLTVFIVEDSIVGAQHDYSSHGNWTNYMHMGTVRGVATNKWGDPLTVNDADRTFEHHFTYTLPEDYNFMHCKVVAFVHQYNASDINSCPVLNAAQSGYLNDYLGIAEADKGCTLQLYPNPARNLVVVEADEPILSVSIVNGLGQQVFGHAAGQGSQMTIATDNLVRGIYLVAVRTAQGVATRKLSVVK